MAGETHHRKPPLPLLLFIMKRKNLPAKIFFVIGFLTIISGIRVGVSRAAGGGVNLISVRPKILSLSGGGDGLNDRVIFRFAPEPESKLTLKIFPLGGGEGLSSEAREINYNFDGSGYVTWDGRSNGNYFVQPGIYIYQIEADGKIFNGTLVVAR